MNTLKEWVVEKPLNEVKFKWFTYEGKEVPYGEHVNWSFQVQCDGVDINKVIKVVLPVCDYGSNIQFPMVKIYCRDVIEVKSKNKFTSLKSLILEQVKILRGR